MALVFGTVYSVSGCFRSYTNFNCGMKSVTAICLSSHIALSFRLNEIKILIRIISQGEEVNRGIRIGMLFEF